MRVLLIFILIVSSLKAQNCSLTLYGRVVDEHDAQPLELSYIVLGDNAKVAYSNAEGFFQFTNLCPGEYHLLVAHLSCETQSYFINLQADSSLVLYLEHHDELLQTVTITEKKVSFQKSLAKVNIQGDELEKKQGGSLGDILKSIAGVNSLQTGSGLSKPIIHGLFGNRILIMNNEIAIQGQQWGNEHAPEIDPFTVNKISIVKGSYGLKYGTRAMGGVVLLDSEDMPTDNHIHGSASFLAFTNGLKGAASLKLEGGFKENPYFKWRMQGSFSKSGDNHSARYYLFNTARQEFSTKIQLQYKRETSVTMFQWSIYQYQLGILRGSHIGNLSDLEDAFSRSEPFYTQNRISFKLNKPKQDVLHNTIKLSHLMYLEKREIDLSYTYQLNKRKEFDVRRSSDKASLFLNLESHEAQVAYKLKHNLLKNEWGIQFQNKVNYNDPNLNVQALLPNYRSNQLSIYSLQSLDWKKSTLDFGVRYEYQNTLVKYYENRILLNPRYQFNNYALSLGFYHQTNWNISTRTSISLLSRSPEINELFSNGLHHGAAAIEKGNPNFTNERMWSFNQTFTYVKDDKFQLELTPYYQYFYNYIQLLPQESLELTIRGAFPVFSYSSSRAGIGGFDLGMHTQVLPHFFWNLQAAIVRGKNLDNRAYLSYMPSDYLQNSLTYALPINKKLQELNFGFTLRNVWQQVREPNFDFAPAPQGYTLLGLEIAGKIQFSKIRMNWQFEANNLLNTSYRDYLNRWRYFADDMGINIALRTKFIF